LEKLKWDLTLFAEEKEEEEEETTEQTESSQEKESEGEKPDQAYIDDIVKRRLKRERKQWQKELENQFGTTDLNQAKEYFEAGKAVSTASGKRPRDVLNRLGQRKAQQSGNNPAGSQATESQEDVRKEIEDLKSMIQEQQEQEIKEKEESEAKKEYGELFDQYREDIEEVADDKDLSLSDAAAVVLRPHLKEHFQKQTEEKQKKKRKKKVDATDDSPDSNSDDNLMQKLTSREKEVARRMGITPKRYAERLQEQGELE